MHNGLLLPQAWYFSSCVHGLAVGIILAYGVVAYCHFGVRYEHPSHPAPPQAHASQNGVSEMSLG